MPGTERRHRKKALKSAIKCELVGCLRTQFTTSIRQACRMLSLSKREFRYQPDTQRGELVIMAQKVVAERYPSADLRIFLGTYQARSHLQTQACTPDLLSVKKRMDNGAELISLTLAEWAEEHSVMLKFIRPGKPTQNAFIERFNRTYRTEILNFYLFRTLNEAREIT